jgi:serine/threonine protein kinase/Tol biopolymer transport system component
MSLATGARLGVYEIVGALGAGGMGEVYRARDTKLNREVAIKVLPDVFAGDSDRHARFQREAQLLASLNHPHIAAIYGFEESGGVRALVLELVEGPTLADRIARDQIPFDEAKSIALQLCDALEAAHERGIVHRDLKPANIKLTSDGSVKVLDFGLAKLQAGEAGGLVSTGVAANPSMSPTLTVHATNAGMILGTAAYMSPEQARGKPVDKRADIWAFGCVLFEMLTRKQPFDTGDNVSDTIASILKNDVDWDALPAAAPQGVRRLLHRCLKKDPRERLRDIGDARLEIVDAAKTAPTGDGPVVAVARVRRERIAWLSLAAGLSIALAALVMSRRPPSTPAPMRVEITTPPSSNPESVALSPDGRVIVFVANADGRSRLWLRMLDRSSVQPLNGTDNATFPFWSPDGRSIGFFADGKVKRLDLDSGAPRVIANAAGGMGGSWGRDGTVVYSPNGANGPIFRTSASGGETSPVTQIGAVGGHRFPQLLPDGRHVLYIVVGAPDVRGAWVSLLNGFAARRLVDADNAVYSSTGHLFFVHDSALFAQQLDLESGSLAGTPQPVAERTTPGSTFALSTSDVGSILFRVVGAVGGLRQFVWFDRSGARLSAVGEPMTGLSNPSLAPDGLRVAHQRVTDGNIDIWLLDTVRGITSRFTADPALDGVPIWSPDGRRIAFSSRRGTAPAIYEKPSDSSRPEQVLLPAETGVKAPLSWTPDGRTLLYRALDVSGGTSDLSAVSFDTRQQFAVAQTAFDERDGQFSPDGKWVAYLSDESGRFEVYVQPFPGPGGRERISANGGAQVRWRRDGRELFYISLDGTLTAVPIRLDSERHTVDAGTPVGLFATHVGGAVQSVVFERQQYMVSPDGQRFLMNTLVEDTTSTPITLILNWRPRP